MHEYQDEAFAKAICVQFGIDAARMAELAGWLHRTRIENQRTEWQPISTAPTDGRDFVTLIPAAGERPAIHGIAYFDKECEDFVQYGCGFDYVTHWAPIPCADTAKPIAVTDTPSSVNTGQISTYGAIDQGYEPTGEEQ